MGKDRVVYGVGYTWNPSDILNPATSPLYKDKERRGEEEGIFISSMSWAGQYNHSAYELRALIAPQPDPIRSKGAISLKLNWNTLEVMQLAGFLENQMNTFAGYIRTPCPGYEDLTIFGEYRNRNFTHDWEYLAGLQLNPAIDWFDGNLQLQVEYFHNQAGFLGPMSAFSTGNPAPILSEVRKNYISAGIGYMTLDGYASLGILKNLDQDQSTMINLYGTFGLTSELMLRAGSYLVLSTDSEKEFTILTNKKYEMYLDLVLAFGVSSQ